MRAVYFERVAVIGVGLIGASVALAMKKNSLSGHVSGSGRKEENLRRAREKGIIDSYSLDPAEASKGSDLIVLAAPVGAFSGLVKLIAPSLKKGSIVIDVGSVKGNLQREIEGLMPPGVHFVGCHPIAGSDRSGIDAASHDLFRGALCIVTKTLSTDRSAGTDNSAFEAVSRLWEALGATLKEMDPDEHDRVYALVSHMPHLAAYALVNAVSGMDGAALSFAGQGFRDTTRIASSSPEMWRDISMLNRENLIKCMDALRAEIEKLIAHLKEGDAASLEGEFERAKKVREALNFSSATPPVRGRRR